MVFVPSHVLSVVDYFLLMSWTSSEKRKEKKKESLPDGFNFDDLMIHVEAAQTTLLATRRKMSSAGQAFPSLEVSFVDALEKRHEAKFPWNITIASLRAQSIERFCQDPSYCRFALIGHEARWRTRLLEPTNHGSFVSHKEWMVVSPAGEDRKVRTVSSSDSGSSISSSRRGRSDSSDGTMSSGICSMPLAVKFFVSLKVNEAKTETRQFLPFLSLLDLLLTALIGAGRPFSQLDPAEKASMKIAIVEPERKEQEQEDIRMSTLGATTILAAELWKPGRLFRVTYTKASPHRKGPSCNIGSPLGELHLADDFFRVVTHPKASPRHRSTRRTPVWG